MAIKIMLDAGHYGKRNQSPVYPSYCESKQMWKLHLLLKKRLEEYGFVVGQTRSDQEKDLSPVYNRGILAKGYDLFISLHSDASDSEGTNRATVFYAFDDFNKASSLAQKLSHAVGLCMGVSGKIKTRKSDNANTDYYGVMRGARAAGCPLYFIIEHSFHTNKNSAEWLTSEGNLDKLAKAEAEVIAEHFGVKKKEEPKAEEKTEEKTATDNTKVEPAKSKDSNLKGTYKVNGCSMLNVRKGAGTSKGIIVAIPAGTAVKNYGYYTEVSGTKWLSVAFTYKGVSYTGYVSSKYLKKQ